MREPVYRRIDLTAAWTQFLAPPSQDSRIVVWSMSLYNCAVIQDVQVYWGGGAVVSDTLSGLMVAMPVGGSIIWQQGPRPVWVLPIGQTLGVNASLGGRLTGFLCYSFVRTQEDWDAETSPSVLDLNRAVRRLLHEEPVFVSLGAEEPGITAPKEKPATEILKALFGGKQRETVVLFSCRLSR